MKTKKHFPIVGFQKDVAIMFLYFTVCIVYCNFSLVTILPRRESKEKNTGETVYRKWKGEGIKRLEEKNTEELILSFRLA